MNDKAIIIAGFGVIDNRARAASFDRLIQQAKEECQGYDVRCIFTSSFVIRKLRDQNIYIERLDEVLEKLRAQAYKEVVIQPTHLSSGEEYEKKIVEAALACQGDFSKITIGNPLLSSGKESDLDEVIGCMAAMYADVGTNEEIVFVGHGSLRRENYIFKRLQEKIDQTCAHITIALLESSDCLRFDDVLSRLRKKNAGRVRLIPLLFVAGMHARIDLAGPHDLSWKSRLLSAGFQVQLSLNGIGEHKPFRDIYIRRIKEML